MYLEYPLILAQQSILFYFVLKYKNLVIIEILLLSMLAYLTIILFMAEILPRIVLDFLIVSIEINVFLAFEIYRIIIQMFEI